MTLLDIFSNPANLSAIIEFLGLVGTVFLFFRKMNNDNIKQVNSLKENLMEHRKDIRERIDEMEKRLCQRLAEVKIEVDKLENNFYSHLGNIRYPSSPISNIDKERWRNGNKDDK